MAKILEVNNLVKYYGDICAVNNISFCVEEGTFFSFLGHNGAGKSTTINIICTLLNKDRGSVKVSGYEVGKHDDDIRKNIGVVFQDSLLDDNLTVEENLRLRASFYGLNEKDTNIKLDELHESLGINNILKQKYGTLSGGQKRKIDIARALVNSPKLLILDEPTTGLDPNTRIRIWNTLRKLQQNTNITLFLTTHYMEETINSDEIVIIDNGHIVAQGSPKELRSKYSNDILKLYYNDNLIDELNKLNLEYENEKNKIIINIKNSKDGLDIVNSLNSVDEFEIIKGTMDQVFLNVTNKVGDRL